MNLDPGSLLKNVMLPKLVSELDIFINCSVQSYWNLLENVIVTCTDIVAPINVDNFCPHKNKRDFIPPHITVSFARWGKVAITIHQCG